MIQQLSVLAMLGICSLEDLKTKQIHTAWLAVFAAEGLAGALFIWQRPVNDIIAAMLPGIFILIVSFAAHGAIGQGDGMILIILGTFLQVSFLVGMLMTAVCFSAGYALFLFIIKKKNRKDEMPFIPFLFIAYVAEILLEKYY